MRLSYLPSFGNSRVRMAIVFATALAVRIVVLLYFRETPFYRFPIVDGLQFHSWAQDFMHGNFFGNGAFPKAPLYPVLLGLLYKVTGPSLGAARLVQCLIGSINCVLILHLSSRFSGPAFSFAAGLFAAVYGPFVFFDLQILRPTLLILFFLLFSIFLEMAFRKRTVRHLSLAGAALGFSALVKPVTLVMVPFVAVWIATRSWVGMKDHDKPMRVEAMAAFLGTLFILLMPATIHNVLASGDFVLVSFNGGINFFSGNNRFADGTTPVLPGIRWNRVMRRQESFPEVRPSGISMEWYREGVRFWKREPVSALRLLGRKILALAGNREIRNNFGYDFVADRVPPLGILPAGFSILVALSIPGLAAARGMLRSGDGRMVLTVVFPIICIFFVNLVFFTCSRFRIPAVPFMMVLGAAGLEGLAESFRQRRRLELAGMSFFIAAAFLGSVVSGRITADSVAGRDNLNLGLILQKAGRPEEAEAEFLRAIAASPGDPDPRLSLGILLEGLGRTDEALRSYAMAVKQAPDYAEALCNMAGILTRKGRPVEAGSLLHRAVLLEPRNGLFRFNLGSALEAMGLRAKAVREYAAAIKYGGPLPAAYNNLGYLFVRMNRDLENAVAMLKQALAMKPGDPVISESLAEGLFLTGDPVGARNLAVSCLSRIPGHPDASLCLGRTDIVFGSSPTGFMRVGALLLGVGFLDGGGRVFSKSKFTPARETAIRAHATAFCWLGMMPQGVCFAPCLLFI